MIRPAPAARDAAVERALAGMPLALSTTWASLESVGADLRVDQDCLVVNAPHIPGHLWSCALGILDPARVDEARHWYDASLLVLPGRERPAFGLPARPSPEAWRAVPCPPLGQTALQWYPQHWVALRAEQVVPQHRLAPGLSLAPMGSPGLWERWAEQDSPAGPGFVKTWAELKRARHERGDGFFVAGLAGDRLVASGGVTLCRVGGRLVGRFEDIQTDEDHRRRGIASHLLAAAHDWARAQGAEATILVADAEGEAIGLYQRLGFTPVDEAWMVLPRRVASPAGGGAS